MVTQLLDDLSRDSKYRFTKLALTIFVNWLAFPHELWQSTRSVGDAPDAEHNANLDA